MFLLNRFSFAQSYLLRLLLDFEDLDLLFPLTDFTLSFLERDLETFFFVAIAFVNLVNL